MRVPCPRICVGMASMCLAMPAKPWASHPKSQDLQSQSPSGSNNMIAKALDQKLARLHADPLRARDFILADAKDADMAMAIGAPGRSPEKHASDERFRSIQQYREIIEQIVKQGLVDIMLTSAA